MNAKLKKGSSFTWQSIMAGDNTLRHGYIWELEMVRKLIFGKMLGSLTVLTEKSLLHRISSFLSKVSDFIDPSSNRWDEDLIRQILWPVDS